MSSRVTRSVATWHRMSIGIIGVVCVAAAVAVILVRLSVDPVAEWVARIDTAKVVDAVDASWFLVVLGVLAVVTLVWGVQLLWTALVPHRPGPVAWTESGVDGTMTVPVQPVADAVAESLRGQTILREVQARAVDDRGRTVLQITVTARPERTYAEVVETVSEQVALARTAFEGSDVPVQTLIHFLPVER